MPPRTAPTSPRSGEERTPGTGSTMPRQEPPARPRHCGDSMEPVDVGGGAVLYKCRSCPSITVGG